MTAPKRESTEPKRDESAAREAKGGTCAGWEVVCPDGRVRSYPYHNYDDAESMARLATRRQCRLWPEPSPIELEQPACPEGVHTVRPIVFVHVDHHQRGES